MGDSGWECFLLTHSRQWWQPPPAGTVPGWLGIQRTGGGCTLLWVHIRLLLGELCWAWAMTGGSLAEQQGDFWWCKRQGEAPGPAICSSLRLVLESSCRARWRQSQEPHSSPCSGHLGALPYSLHGGPGLGGGFTVAVTDLKLLGPGHLLCAA